MVGLAIGTALAAACAGDPASPDRGMRPPTHATALRLASDPVPDSNCVVPHPPTQYDGWFLTQNPTTVSNCETQIQVYSPILESQPCDPTFGCAGSIWWFNVERGSPLEHDFQSTRGTARTRIVHLRFSKPVGKVVVRASGYVRYGNNRVVAYDSAYGGNVVGEFTFVPSMVSIDPRDSIVVTATRANPPGIRRVEIIPDPAALEVPEPGYGELLRLRVEFDPDIEENTDIDVECKGPAGTPTLTRGETVMCVATAKNGGSLAVAGWSFQDGNGDVMDRTDNPTSTTWHGVMVASGTVRVHGTIDGAEASGRASVTVQARSWAGRVAEKAHSISSPGPLPPRPSAFKGQLGRTLPGLISRSDVADLLLTIADDGPNHLYTYLSTIPVITETVVSVNTTALSVNSDFYRIQESRQRTIGKVTYCAQSFVIGIIPLVEAHEGTVPASYPNSHAAIFQRNVDTNAPTRYEAWTDRNNRSPLGELKQSIYDVAWADSDAMDRDARNNLNSNTVPCEFKYDYSRLR